MRCLKQSPQFLINQVDKPLQKRTSLMNISNLTIANLTLCASMVFSHGTALAQVPSSSPYKTDPQFVYNEDDTSEAFNVISVVSCYVRNMAPEIGYNQVGGNPYVAMVDTNKCESNEVSTSSGGGVSATPSYDTAVVLPSLGADGALDFSIWITGSDTIDDNNDGEPDKIWVRGSVTGSASKVPPFGQWEVRWCTEYNAQTNSCMDFGLVTVSPEGMRGFNRGDRPAESWESAVIGIIAADESSGGGKFSKSWTDSGNSGGSSGLYAFNDQFAFSSVTPSGGGASTDRCVIPNSSNPGAIKSPWETWLYDASSGERVDVNSGFSIRDVATGKWGWAGAWGADISGTPLIEGQRVRRMGSNDEVLGTYTGFTAPGKLRKAKVTSTTLSAIQDLELSVNMPKRILPGFSSSDEWVNATLIWDGSNLVINAWLDCGPTGCERKDLQNPIIGSLAAVSDKNNGLGLNELWAWQNGTGTSYRLIFAKWVENAGQWTRQRYTTPETVVVTSRRDSIVNPNSDDVPSVLYCVGPCADENLAYTNGWELKKSVVESKQYSWDQSSLTLSLNGKAIDFTNKDRSYWSGALVSQQGLAKLACKVDDEDSGQEVDGYCQGLVDLNLSEFYNWESGPDRWNRFSGIRDENNAFVTFEEPLFVTYTVPDDDTSEMYRGKTVSVQYPGGGNLWLPGYCFDETTFQRKTCGDGDTGWANEFTIPFDENVGYVTGEATNTRYLVKTLRQGVYYATAQDQNSQACQDLRTESASFSTRDLPTRDDWVNPADPSSSAYIGAWRTPSSAPLIIDGKLQTAN
jgi:hypothetical protein